MKVYALCGSIEYSSWDVIQVFSSKKKAFEAKDKQDRYCKTYNLQEFILCGFDRYIWYKKGMPESGYGRICTGDVRDRLKVPRGKGWNSCFVKEFRVL